jgi:deoxyadenosine/deoxycytidine kinase
LDPPPNFVYSFIISLEGNLAAGKSTILRMAESSLIACGYEVACQPAEFMPALPAAYYNSPKMYAATLQAAIMMGYHSLVQAKCPKVLIVERSPVSSLQVFAKNMLDQEVLSAADYSFLRWLFHLLDGIQMLWFMYGPQQLYATEG